MYVNYELYYTCSFSLFSVKHIFNYVCIGNVIKMMKAHSRYAKEKMQLILHEQ